MQSSLLKKLNLDYKSIVLFLLATLLSIGAAIINGFPISYMDVGTYIDSGFEGYAPPDRPVFYGLFLRHISLSRYLFLVVLTQALLACWLIRDLIRTFVQPQHVNAIFLLSVVMLVLTTSYSVVTSLLIPDIFTPLCYLALVNILWGKVAHPLTRRAYYVAFVFFIITQNASILSFLVIVPLLFIYFSLNKDWAKTKKCIHLFGSLGIAILLVGGHNYFSTGKARLSAMSHVFIMNRMIEFGVIQDYLNKNCEPKNYRICPYKDSLQWDFIFNKNSVVYKTGGWEANRNEYNTILKDMLFSKEYGFTILKKTTFDAVKQLYTFDAYVDPPLLKGSPPYGQIKWRFDNELNRYETSSQNQGTFHLTYLNALQRVVIVISSGILLFGLFFKRKIASSILNKVIYTFIVFMLVNAFIASFFATVDARYQMRLIWLLPLFAVLNVYVWRTNRKSVDHN